MDLANNVIANNFKQYKKDLKSVLNKFVKPEVNSFEEMSEEAIFVADRIEGLLAEGVNPHKIAVLFRAAHHSQALEMELMKRKIVYDYRGGVRFFERSHIKDVLAYLKILNNQQDEVSWRRVLKMQVGIGDVTIDNILKKLKIEDFRIQNIELPARASVGWNDFLQIFEKIKNAEDVKVGDLIRVICESKYVEYLENEYPDYRERLQDLEQLAVFADKAEDLNTFLAESTLQENFRTPHILPPVRGELEGGSGEKIILSTIHQAKGLEWSAVFIINFSNGQFPNERAMHERDGLDEERRLFYVAITRAEKYLYITYSMVGSFGGFQGGPSMFLQEVDYDLLDREVDSTVFDDELTYVSEDEPTKKRSGFLKNLDEL